MCNNLECINGIKVLNLTPHAINLINVDKTYQQRDESRILKEGLSLKDATDVFIKRSSLTLSVVENKNIFINIGSPALKLFTPIFTSTFNQFIPIDLLENADIIIVSPKCAQVINANLPLVQNGMQTIPLDIIQLDKFYIPKISVYYSNNVTIPIGSLGLQKVTTFMNLSYYVSVLNCRRNVSCPSLMEACRQYLNTRNINHTMYAPQSFDMEKFLRVANDYLESRGFQRYPELEV